MGHPIWTWRFHTTLRVPTLCLGLSFPTPRTTPRTTNSSPETPCLWTTWSRRARARSLCSRTSECHACRGVVYSPRVGRAAGGNGRRGDGPRAVPGRVGHGLQRGRLRRHPSLVPLGSLGGDQVVYLSLLSGRTPRPQGRHGRRLRVLRRWLGPRRRSHRRSW